MLLWPGGFESRLPHQGGWQNASDHAATVDFLMWRPNRMKVPSMNILRPGITELSEGGLVR